MKTRKRTFSILLSFVLLLISFSTVVAKDQIDDVFVNEGYISLLDDLIEAETNYGLSGAQLAVYKDGKLIKNSAYGYINKYENIKDKDGNIISGSNRVLEDENLVKVTQDTIFDLASNTKMYATVYAIQKLVSEGKINLDTKIHEIFPEFLDHANENNWKEEITLRMILSHRAGFVPSPKYHDENYDKADMIENGKNDLYSQDKKTTFEMVMKTPLVRKPDTEWEYSDVDMMLAGFIVEKLSGLPLDRYVKENIYEPLKLNEITFNPLKNGFNKNQIAATEVNGNTRGGRRTFNNIRKYVLQGEVHDEKAFHSFEGVAGHAGLFASAKQIAYLGQAMLKGGELNSVKLFDQKTIDSFMESSEMNSQAIGGWRRKSEDGKGTVWFSKFAPVGTIGHTGWTGTNTLIDKENNITLSLNTNARNTTIMGPGDNDFYTKRSNISSYGLVSELVYRGLGLGQDEIESPEELLINLIENKINKDGQEVDLNEKDTSYRNVIRSLISVLVSRKDSNTKLNEYYNTEKIKNVISLLGESHDRDLKEIRLIKSEETETGKENKKETEKETQKNIDKDSKKENGNKNNKKDTQEINVKEKNPKTSDKGLYLEFTFLSTIFLVMYIIKKKEY
ncbi:penicillin binding protein PBP4B [Helcococcus ovis]|uniref:penicillin binding protein PBP4B n=1 Tax=Helcococcus ovis TaxID=72026 RepID=UPI0038BBBEDA